MKKKILYVVPLIIIFVVLSATYVLADEIPEGYYMFRNYNSDLYMDCEGTTNGSNIRQMDFCLWRNSQKFKVVKDASVDGYYTIELDGASLKVVDVDGASTNNTANVQLYDSNRTDAQRWKFISNNDTEGTYRVASKCSGDTKVLTVSGASKTSGANIFQYSYTSNPDGKWYMEAIIDDGLYMIRNKTTGKYLTVSDSFIVQDTYDPGNYQKQLFQITGDNEGYYDIAPVFDKNKSISVRGWSSGNDTEGEYIGCEEGQSSEGQCWRFLLNANGTFRIVSQLSNCRKSITVLDSNESHTYSCTYTSGNNSDWELVKWYEKESEHFIVDFDTITYLLQNIMPENFNKWMENMDLAYEAYEELVGGVPAGGAKIHIKDITRENPEYYYENLKDGISWASPNGNRIAIREDNVKEMMQKINDTGDWSFLLLHELGHIFDISSKWFFHHEFSANFKMVYLFYKYDGDIKVLLNCKEQLNVPCTRYEEIKNYYAYAASESYIYSLGADIPSFTNDGLTYVVLNLLDDDWEGMKNVYRAYEKEDNVPSKWSDRYILFLDLMDEKLIGKNVMERYMKRFLPVHDCICEGITDYYNSLTKNQ